MTVRVRFAPSPTGFLHIGGARTALFNWLFARHMGGTFILRIEDTDELRSTKEFEQAIFGGLKWLGLNWDEGPVEGGGSLGDYAPYFQGERAAKHNTYAPYAYKLLEEGKAYKCYCTSQELEEERKQAMLEKRPPKYSGKCRSLTADEQAKLEAGGRQPVIRFKMPEEGSTSFNDLIRGPVTFENKLLYDFIMLKPNGHPTYNFACVIDDHLMKITHVFRGNDHIANTAHQYNLYKALGFELPEFMHMSMIHGPDGTKLSKRHGHTSVLEYENEGILPEAMVNFLALLGWSTPDSQQLFEKGELEQKFDIKGCQKNPAIFDPVKLAWMNGEYIRKMPVKELVKRAMPFLEKAGINADAENLENIVELEHEKYKNLAEIPNLISFFYTEDFGYDQASVEKVLHKPEAKSVLEGMIKAYGDLQNFSETDLEARAREYAKDNGLKAGQVFHPLRVALSGRTQGPTLFKMIEYLGKERVVKRLAKATALCCAPTEG